MRKTPGIMVSPSLLASDFGNLRAEIKRAEQAGADELHLDIMDARFVRNLTMGPDIVRTAREAGGLRLSVHLMMMQPRDFLDAFIDAGAGTLLIHIEAQGDHEAMLRHIRSRNVRAGITLNPETPATAITPVLAWVDEVLVMSVHPGFGGQRFIDAVLPKIAECRRQAVEGGYSFDISVDGGISEHNVAAPAAHGANIFIAGTSLFQAPDMRAAVLALRTNATRARGTAQ